MRSFRGATLLLLFLVLGACATGRQRQPLPPVVETTVEVRNQNFLDMNIYVTGSGHRVRLGTVTGSGTRTFVVPSRVLTGTTVLRFEMYPVGATLRPRPQDVQVAPGHHIVLTVPPR